MQHDPHRPEDVLKVDIDENDSEMISGDDFYDSGRYGIMAKDHRSGSIEIDYTVI